MFSFHLLFHCYYIKCLPFVFSYDDVAIMEQNAYLLIPTKTRLDHITLVDMADAQNSKCNPNLYSRMYPDSISFIV